jgi:hypothetical protein
MTHRECSFKERIDLPQRRRDQGCGDPPHLSQGHIAGFGDRMKKAAD